MIVYNPPGDPGLPIYQPILEDLYPRYTHGLLLGDLNTNQLSNLARTADLKMRLESVSLSIISREPTNFTAATPTLIEPNANILFSHISSPEMNTDHDLIYGTYKVSDINENPTQPEKIFCCGYNNINMEQLLSDIYVQDWNYIYDTSDPE
jgi:hypothetical protein